MNIWLNRLNAAIFALIGVWCLLKARSVATTLGIEFTEPQGLTDFRATYGGMCLALGIFFAWATLKDSWTVPSLYLAALLFAGLGLTRLAGVLCDGSPTVLTISFLVVEIFLTLLNLLAARR